MRKSEIVRVPDSGGRDAGKYFQITEWSASEAEKWAMSALLAYNRGGGQIDTARMLGLGMEAIFVLGINTFLRGQMQASEIIPILDRLLECVKIVRDPKARDTSTGQIVATSIVSPDDIEEVGTRLWLRSEVLRVHTGFSPAAAVKSLISAIMARQVDSPNT
jgi:hypothetical protein